VQKFFDSISHPALAGAFATLTICVLIVVALAAIGRDHESVRVGAVIAVICAVVCATANLSVPLGWLEVDALFAVLLASWAQSQGRRFWVWFAVALIFGWLIALIAIKVADWLERRGDTYGAGVPSPAAAS
jgi:hypothetical protein